MKKNYLRTTLTAMSLLFSLTTFSQQSSQTVQIGATQRSYIRYLPSGLNASEEPSLIFILHGIGGTNSDLLGAGFNTLIADTARVIAIYPQGAANQFGQNSWNNGTLLSSSVDDIAFFNTVLDEMIATYNVNPSRVYFTGFSMGSIMTYHVACAMNDRVAAIGAMAGTMSTSDLNTCNPEYATPVIHLHGTADGTVPYNSNPLPSLSLVPETIAFWQDVHGCDEAADSLRYTDLANDNITVDRFRYDNCSPDASLELWRFNGADHVYLYQPANDINEMLEVWRFLTRWTLPVNLSVNEEQVQPLKISPNPSTGIFTIATDKQTDYTLSAANGQLVRTGTIHGDAEIDLSKETEGVYLLQSENRVYRLVKQ